MKDILTAFCKRLAIGLGVLVCGSAAFFLARGEGRLTLAFVLGLFAALVFVSNMAHRLWTLSSDTRAARGQMLVGMIVRLVVFAGILAVAVLASPEVFFAAAAGFVLTYLVTFALLILQEAKK
ncbi:hypothetical protein [Selenomonas sp.]|uniref:hypothetical protein n=1 Tax=Selenomonas sp. TaxID=2053611 RepID=UPI0025EEC20D|nr:hypothetical protein [Selenomonas sp.]MCI6284011.1 hypothetical protein [Selenomonas sp.]